MAIKSRKIWHTESYGTCIRLERRRRVRAFLTEDVCILQYFLCDLTELLVVNIESIMLLEVFLSVELSNPLLSSILFIALYDCLHVKFL